MKSGFLSAAAAVALLGACGGEDPVDDNESSIEEEDEDEDQSDSDDEDAPSTRRDAGKDAGKDAGGARPRDGGATPPGKDSGSGTGSGDQVGGGAALPCDIQEIVEKNCSNCHGEEPIGVDFSLTNATAFQGDAKNGKPRYEVALERVKLTTARRMPPPPDDPVSGDDLEKLTTWLEGGAKAGTEKCTPSTGGSGSDAGSIPASTAGSGGASLTPLEYDDPNLECHPFVAFASPAMKSTPYMVPTTPDYYVAFNMKAPWSGVRYIRSFKSVIDNAKVLHHWLLFKNLGATPEGVVGNALGAHPDGEMLYGWAPGGDDLYMHEDLGIEMPGDNTTYQVELHYNNTGGAPAPDASGVEICTTSTKPEKLSQLSWVGTDAIAGTSATGTCTHGSSEPIRIFNAQPHMHTKGSHMKVVVTRANGQEEVIHDKDFSFDNQRGYLMDVTLMPGDVMTTTCTFSEFAVFGKGTSDEMCYFFTQSWPAGALSSPIGIIGQAIHGPNTCIDAL